MMSWSSTDQEGLTDRSKYSTSSQTKELYDFNSVTSIGKKKNFRCEGSKGGIDQEIKE